MERHSGCGWINVSAPMAADVENETEMLKSEISSNEHSVIDRRSGGRRLIKRRCG
jgi:hypothetical protein